jgi:hypothetical protein
MIQSPDDFYEALLNTHQGLSLDARHALNARLVLLLADRVGSNQVLNEVLHLAKTSSTKEDFL